VGFFDSEIGRRFQAIVESVGLDPTPDKSRDRRRPLFDTICYSDYPTSCKPKVVAFSHSGAVNHTSRMRSIIYSFRRPSGTPSAYVYIINEDYSGKIIPAATIRRSEWRREDSRKRSAYVISKILKIFDRCRSCHSFRSLRRHRRRIGGQSAGVLSQLLSEPSPGLGQGCVQTT
jgi:hypothetical protein